MMTRLAVSCVAAALAAAAAGVPAVAAPSKEKLMNPASCNEKAPAAFSVRFETSQGNFLVEVTRDWAPRGADRFYNLVKNGYYDGTRFFRVMSGFVAQFGIHGDPAVSAVWRSATIPDDPVKESNKQGTLTFATAGPSTRTTQLFINLNDNARLDGHGFSPFGRVVDGMGVVDKLYSGYGDSPPNGQGPDQGKLQAEGNVYLLEKFPKLDYVKKATLVKADEKRPGSPAEGKPEAKP